MITKHRTVNYFTLKLKVFSKTIKTQNWLIEQPVLQPKGRFNSRCRWLHPLFAPPQFCPLDVNNSDTQRRGWMQDVGEAWWAPRGNTQREWLNTVISAEVAPSETSRSWLLFTRWGLPRGRLQPAEKKRRRGEYQPESEVMAFCFGCHGYRANRHPSMGPERDSELDWERLCALMWRRVST